MSSSSPFLWVDSPGHQKHDASTRKQIAKHVMVEIGKARRKPKKRRIMSKEYSKLKEEPISQLQPDDKDHVVNSQSSSEQGFDSVLDDDVLTIYRNPVNEATRNSLFSRSMTGNVPRYKELLTNNTMSQCWLMRSSSDKTALSVLICGGIYVDWILLRHIKLIR
jgi:hypothetical protein